MTNKTDVFLLFGTCCKIKIMFESLRKLNEDLEILGKGIFQGMLHFTTFRKLKSDGLFERYNNVFKEWESEGTTKPVGRSQDSIHHIFSHIPVLKEHRTTKAKPVFDALAQEKK